MKNHKLATLISGRGSTMYAIGQACLSGEIPDMEMACVIASNREAEGIEKAKSLKIPVVVVDPDDYREDKKINQDTFGQRILEELRRFKATAVGQYGWLYLTPASVIEAYTGAIWNQHNGPVPEFGGKGMYGRRVHAARLLFARMVKRDYWTEAVAQKVAVEYDQGEVIKSERIEILPVDTVDTLTERVLPIEHRVQIELLKDFANGIVMTVPERETLVRPGEEEILELVKRYAKLLYPNG